ncbi:hypothetical protein [Xanthobacter autotrophicus]|uniref:hypothetical protein n=1 Tax=Xanthobacter autotrophicus TaxID=280 RepID=UPI0037262DFB
MTKLADLKKRLGADPQFQAEYERADAEYSQAESVIRERSGKVTPSPRDASAPPWRYRRP